tara:strand:- start:608 stop:1084 length:477 start_codon:yes stop_codon:yes gene_type:complete
MSKIYRYNFSKEFLEKASLFSKNNELSDIKTFRENWNLWKQDNEKLIIKENRKLINMGYAGNIDDKMFKTVRYYLKKKEKKEKKDRRKYIPLTREFIDCIDNHIKNCKDIKPSNAFIDFEKKNNNIIKNEIDYLKKYLNDENCKEKIKKTYKNRYSKK